MSAAKVDEIKAKWANGARPPRPQHRLSTEDIGWLIGEVERLGRLALTSCDCALSHDYDCHLR